MMIWIAGIVFTLVIVGAVGLALGSSAGATSKPVVAAPPDENVLSYSFNSLKGFMDMLGSQPEVAAAFVTIVSVLIIVGVILVYRLIRRG